MRIANVPFYSNTFDGTHCVQASLRMVLKYFEPEKEFSWQELDRITAKIKGLSTWKSAMWVWLAEHNYDLHVIELFNVQRFIKEGGDYLKDEFGEEAAAWQIKHSNIPQEQQLYKKLLETIPIENREPRMSDIKGYLDNGYLVCVAVNSKKLAGLSGYVGHQIVVTGYDENTIIINNPGPPAHEGQIVNRQDFEAAWASPNVMAKELFAVKIKSK